MTHRATCNTRLPHVMPALPSYVTAIHITNAFFTNLTKKTFLFIPCNRITVLEIWSSHIHHVEPDTFEEFVNLKYLNLGSNRIDPKSLKHSLANVNSHRLNWLLLKSMGWTDMSINMFSGVPNSIRYVDISYNRQIKLSDGMFNGLEEIFTLRFTYSKLPKCGNSFKQLKSLSTLDLSFNEIAMCNIHILPRTLKQLNLSWNSLRNIPDFCLSNGSSSVPSLETLYLEKNLIDSITSVSVYCLNSLSKLSLENNFIKSVSSNCLPKNLQELILKSNFILTVPDFCSSNWTSNFPYLRKLILGNNQINMLTNRSFACLPSVKTLHLGRNSFGFIMSNTFRNLTQLNDLDLSDLKLGLFKHFFASYQVPVVLDDSFDNPSLKYLNFSHNRILPNISKLPKLEVIDLSNCIEPSTLNSPFVKTKIGRLPHL